MSTATAASPWVTQADNTVKAGSFELPPADNHPAYLIGIIDLGYHDEDYKGKVSVRHKVFFVWELTAEKNSRGENFLIGHEYELYDTLGPKNRLRLMLEAWRGIPYSDKEAIDISSCLNSGCFVNVVHKKSKTSDRVFANVESVKKPLKGYVVPKPTHEPILWDYEPGKEVDLPEWLPFLFGKPVAEKISHSKPIPMAKEIDPGSQEDDDIPF